MVRLAGLAVVALVVSACSGSLAPSLSATANATPSPAASQAIAPTTPPTPLPTPPSALIGNWTRLVSCRDELAAFAKAGLTDQVTQWVVANFVPAGASAPPGNECANAGPAVQHSHFFTADGRFGSRDEHGQQVDDGDYALVDSATLSFPSHAHDFGYAGTILVGFTLAGDSLTFTVKIPAPCEAECRVAYGWALSALYGPQSFTRTGN